MNWIMGYPIPCIFIGANAYQYNDEYSDLYDRLLSIILNTWGLIKVQARLPESTLLLCIVGL